MKQTIQNFLENSIQTKQAILADQALVQKIEEAATALRNTVASGGTIYTCGNGGSACDAMHFTEELVARYKRDRDGIRAIHFQDASVLSCWSNDYEYASVFERQAKTFCKSGDTLVGISTSGNSDNVLRAVRAAKAAGSTTIGLSGKGGGELTSLCDISIVVPSDETDRIQESHITLIHIFCELLETE